MKRDTDQSLGVWLSGLILTAMLPGLSAADGFRAGLEVDQEQRVRIAYEARTDAYVQVWTADTLTNAAWTVPALQLGATGTLSWSDLSATDVPRRYYRLRRVPLSHPEDIDADGMDDVYELQHTILDPLDHTDAGADPDGDRLLNLDEYRHQTDPTRFDTDEDGIDDKYGVIYGIDPADMPAETGLYLNWLYHNAPDFIDAAYERVPGRVDRFLNVDYAQQSNHLYLLAPRNLALSTQDQAEVQLRYAYYIEADSNWFEAWPHADWMTTVVLAAETPFHGLPTMGARTLDLYRVDWPQPAGSNETYVWYSPHVQTRNPSGDITAHAFLLQEPGEGNPANNWLVGPQRTGTNYYDQDYWYLHDPLRLQNGSFEEGTDHSLTNQPHWISWGANGLRVTNPVFEGTAALCLENWDSGVWQYFGVQAGEEIVLSGAMCIPGGTNGFAADRQGIISLEFYDRNWRIIDTCEMSVSDANPRDTWHNLAVTSRVPDRTRIGVAACKINGGDRGQVLFDAIDLAVAADTDRDGMPDAWELAHGLDPDHAGDALDDADDDELNNVDEYRNGTDLFNPDTDGDGLLDSFEVAYGTGPNDLTDSTDPSDATLDPDNDGLSNLEEQAHGTHPGMEDTDRDQIPDLMELYETLTDPLVYDSDGLFNPVYFVDGCDAIATFGEWRTNETTIVALDRRGYVDFQVNVPEPDIFRLVVEGKTFIPQNSTEEFVFDVFVDEVFVRTITLHSVEGASAAASCFMPYLQPGVHFVRLFWQNARSYKTPEIERIEIQALDGDDANGNGTKDWIERRLERTCSLNPMKASKVSPACIEGRSAYPEFMELSTDAPVVRGLKEHWYANVPLSANGTNACKVFFENGALVITNLLTWSPTVVDEGEVLRIRTGDGLLLSPSTNRSPGYTHVEVGGITSIAATVESPTPYVFNNPGVYTLFAACSSNSAVSGCSTVEVLDVDFGPMPYAWVGKTREWTPVNLGSSLVVQTDTELELCKQDDGFELTAHGRGQLGILARIAEDGPIMGRGEVCAFHVYSGPETHLQIKEVFEDGSQEIEMMVLLTAIPPDIAVELDIFVAGVVFDDGTLHKTLSAQDFNMLGEAPVRFLRAAETDSSVCHTLKAFDGETSLGTR